MRHAPLWLPFLLLVAWTHDALAQWGARPPAGLPELDRYEAPAFPAELAERSVLQGYAVVAFTVNEDGLVDDAFALGASHPAFADAVITALGKWQLKPAPSATVPRREVIRFAFSREDAITTGTHLDGARHQFPERSSMPTTVSLEDLAAPPARIFGSKPSVSGAGGTRGQAVVSFIVDSKGAVRVPVVQSTTDPAFGAAALAAVRQWRYAPPEHKGAPVAVSLAQSFSYGPPTIVSRTDSAPPGPEGIQ